MVTFGASVTALLIFVYTAIINDMEEDLKHAIGIQMADLRRTFVVSGANETAAAIRTLLAKDKEQTLVLMLIGPDWHVLAGNLASWPGGKIHTPTWIKFPLVKTIQSANRPPQAIAMNSTLPGGYILLAGHKMDLIERVHEIIVEVLYICFGIMVVLAAAGGMLLSYTIYRRIDSVNQIFRRVGTGDLQARVTLTGMGDEFDHLGMHLNRTLDRIVELIDGARDISYSVAHDLRTPLSRLRHRLERLLTPDSNAEQVKRELYKALFEIDALVATFNAILRIAQAEMGAGIERFSQFDLSQVTLDVVDLYRPVAEESAHIFSADIAADIVISGDRHLVTQMIANVLDNAIKYTPALGTIAVTLAAGDGWAELCVRDSGTGIPVELYSKVTEKFFRVESSRSSPGNGLGLSLVSAAVKLHNGELSFADNAPGLKVLIRLPLTS